MHQKDTQSAPSTRITDICAKRCLYAPRIASMLASAPTLGGYQISSTTAGTLAIAPSGRRHCPRPDNSVSPAGKRGVTSVARNSSHSCGVIALPSALVAPKSNSTRAIAAAGALQTVRDDIVPQPESSAHNNTPRQLNCNTHRGLFTASFARWHKRSGR